MVVTRLSGSVILVTQPLLSRPYWVAPPAGAFRGVDRPDVPSCSRAPRPSGSVTLAITGPAARLLSPDRTAGLTVERPTLVSDEIDESPLVNPLTIPLE